MKKLLLLTILLCSSLLCQAQKERIVLGDEQTSEYFPILKGKRIAIFSNHTGMVGDKHLLDILLENKFNVVAIFSPEHGFRGDADAGEHVSSSVDKKTGVPILSLYDGKDKKPSEASMRKFDILVIDIQDVGLRFYTYYITMCRLMDACAEYNRKVLLLDRPNPNGHYVDGPILDMKYKSGVGWLPIPIVHGMTLGELALMVNGERWLPASRVCDLTVIPCKNYTHQTKYTLPIPPSPNLPNMKAVYLYPATCYFEATPVSLGRGTSLPFQEQSNGRQIIPGLGIYFLDPGEGNWTVDEVERQINFTRAHGLAGEGHYRVKYLMDNTQGLYNILQENYYTAPALQPAMPWIDNVPPTAPTQLNVGKLADGYWKITWQAATDNDKRNAPTYVVYGSDTYPVDTANPENILAQRIQGTEYIYAPIRPWNTRKYFAVTAVDRCGNESPVCQ